MKTVTWPTDQPKEFWDACFLVLTLDYRENYKPYLIILCDRKPKRNRTTLFYIWITIQNTHLTIINNKSTQPSEKTPRAEYMQYCISQSKRCISESMIIHQHKKKSKQSIVELKPKSSICLLSIKTFKIIWDIHLTAVENLLQKIPQHNRRGDNHNYPH